MSEIIEFLTSDHKVMAKLLKLMEQEVESFTLGQLLDYQLIDSILDYLTRASQFKHHKAEDEIYKWLQIRDPGGVLEIGDITLEHEKLAFLCQSLRVAANNVEQDNELPRLWLASVANEYVSAHMRHLKMEETLLFPLSLKKLHVSDWQEVEDHLAYEADPDADQLIQDDLNELKQDILSWNEGRVI